MNRSLCPCTAAKWRPVWFTPQHDRQSRPSSHHYFLCENKLRTLEALGSRRRVSASPGCGEKCTTTIYIIYIYIHIHYTYTYVVLYSVYVCVNIYIYWYRRKSTTGNFKICLLDSLQNRHRWQNMFEQLRKHILSIPPPKAELTSLSITSQLMPMPMPAVFG